MLVTPSSVDVTFGAPVVAVDHNVGSSTLPTVDSDNLSGAVAATEYLLGLGHRRIGFLAGRPGPRVGPAARSAAIATRSRRPASRSIRALIRVGELPAGHPPRTPRGSCSSGGDRPTAIFAANDVSAIATISVARSLGLRVPDDLSVIGFDNVPESALSEPPLTTIEQPIQQMGFDATRLLIGLIESEPVARRTRMLPTRLVVRGSCRAVEATR